MRKDLVQSSDEAHLVRILKAVREMLKRSCNESKKARKDTFKLLFNHFDIFSILSPLPQEAGVQEHHLEAG